MVISQTIVIFWVSKTHIFFTCFLGDPKVSLVTISCQLTLLRWNRSKADYLRTRVLRDRDLPTRVNRNISHWDLTLDLFLVIFFGDFFQLKNKRNERVFQPSIFRCENVSFREGIYDVYLFFLYIYIYITSTFIFCDFFQLTLVFQIPLWNLSFETPLIWCVSGRHQANKNCFGLLQLIYISPVIWFKIRGQAPWRAVLPKNLTLKSNTERDRTTRNIIPLMM